MVFSNLLSKEAIKILSSSQRTKVASALKRSEGDDMPSSPEMYDFIANLGKDIYIRKSKETSINEAIDLLRGD